MENENIEPDDIHISYASNIMDTNFFNDVHNSSMIENYVTWWPLAQPSPWPLAAHLGSSNG